MRSIPVNQRFRIMQRDKFACRYCGADGSTAELEVDHIIPRTKGGKAMDDNLVTSCHLCNSGKSNSSMECEIPPIKTRHINPEAWKRYAERKKPSPRCPCRKQCFNVVKGTDMYHLLTNTKTHEANGEWLLAANSWATAIQLDPANDQDLHAMKLRLGLALVNHMLLTGKDK